ncbi:hypothetical protein C5B42_00270 [Candidatus Cerribacteria bacterium 'Amazon FNV 2010 28 9']|uniref:Uncharacterized protein n=1 Tax=Candidatus Cerribacteria bacterium 'Amazon FNV 2010 28 9' TaxID=2081795 RepID=A0A317JRP7_9BACT|nr:MAG: hypothetical protein C5B42_00270 [Candidatus Cerribacteria bacterium 'Amazon FNV 2010 28 9']
MERGNNPTTEDNFRALILKIGEEKDPTSLAKKLVGILSNQFTTGGADKENKQFLIETGLRRGPGGPYWTREVWDGYMQRTLDSLPAGVNKSVIAEVITQFTKTKANAGQFV